MTDNKKTKQSTSWLKMNYRLSLFTVIGTLFWLNTVHGASFNDEQRHEIEQVVQDYLVKHPEAIVQAIQALQALETKAWAEQVKKVATQHLDELFNGKSPILAAQNPKISIVEFFDYNCPHCKSFLKVLNTTLTQNKDIQVIFKELPILSESSVFAAKAALAAREQNKYQDFHQKLMSFEGVLADENVLKAAKEVGLDMKKLEADMNDPNILAQLRANQKLAVELGIRGTPTIIIGRFPDPHDSPLEVAPGQISQQRLDQMISTVRSQPATKDSN